jgi:hypothetical protein
MILIEFRYSFSFPYLATLLKLLQALALKPHSLIRPTAQLDSQSASLTDRQADRQTGRQADRQKGRKAERQTGRQADWQTDRQTDRQTDG